MLKVSLPIGDDLLEIHHNMWTNKDAIFWNGAMKSRKRRFFSSTHVFRIPTGYNGADDVFRIKVGVGFNGTTYSVMRNDKVLLGTWRNQLTHAKRQQMPNPPELDLNAMPRRQRNPTSAAPETINNWPEEELIL